MIPLLLSAGSAIASYASQASQQQSARRQLEELKSSYLKSMYTPEEEAKSLDRVSDTFNTSMADAMNQYGSGSRGVLNADTLRAVTMAKLVSQKAQALSTEQSKIAGFNREMLAKANTTIDDIPSAPDLGTVFSAGAQGYMLGDQMRRSKLMNDLLEKIQ